mmetsp:Transcript_4486/g.7673  ORF Transcript_4486/g.7673 Transcript_4486/m.7673 type:complete len:339 (-) Transcript_4486:238-1254(-)
MGAVETVIDTVTDNKKYYNCPGCGEEVWAYGSFVGNTCWNCPGTLGDAVLRTGDMAVPVFSATKDALCDNKIEYRCQRCGVKKWAYGAGVGRVCLDCRSNGFAWDSGKYGWYKISEACEVEESLDSILEYDYNDEGDSIEIDGKTFTNVVQKWRLEQLQPDNGGYHEVDWSYSCGCNAINMCLKIWGYGKQLTQSKLIDDATKADIGTKYIYQTKFGVKCGCTFTDFYEKNIKPVFNYRAWKGNQGKVKDADMEWDFLNGTDFTEYSLIILGGDGVGHFTVVIGISEDRSYYLVTDQSLKVWLCDTSLMRTICKYGFSKSQGTVGFNVFNECSMYRVG